MNPLLKAALLCLAIAGSGFALPGQSVVLASDLTSRKMLPPAPELPKYFSWSGVYAGGQIGYAWGSGGNAFKTPGYRLKSDALVGGAHAGFNYQTGALVFGVEGDIEALGRDGASSGVSRDWQASARGRIGYAFDTLMVYGTVGAAFTRFDYAATLPLTPAAEVSRTGWTAGGGVAYAFTDHVIASVEYRYTDFGKLAPFGGGLAGPAFEQDAKLHTMRAALSYLF